MTSRAIKRKGGSAKSLCSMSCGPWKRRRLIGLEPIRSDLLQRLRELLKIDRLAHVAVRAERVTRHQIFWLDRRRQDDDRHQLRARIRAQTLEYLQPVHPRQ